MARPQTQTQTQTHTHNTTQRKHTDKAFGPKLCSLSQAAQGRRHAGCSQIDGVTKGCRHIGDVTLTNRVPRRTSLSPVLPLFPLHVSSTDPTSSKNHFSENPLVNSPSVRKTGPHTMESQERRRLKDRRDSTTQCVKRNVILARRKERTRKPVRWERGTRRVEVRTHWTARIGAIAFASGGAFIIECNTVSSTILEVVSPMPSNTSTFRPELVLLLTAKQKGS